MAKFEIWVEGYAATGQSGEAMCLGIETANTWDEAVEKYMQKHQGKITKDSRGYTDWGCRLFDNETDARKSFG